MSFRVLVAITLSARIGSGQAGGTPMSCEVVVQPSDSGSGRFGDVAEGRAGRLAWTDGRPGQFLVRDAHGTTRTVGRRGAGPGEFERVSLLGWLGDTLWASDGRLPRVQLFSDTGKLHLVLTATPNVSWIPRPGGQFVGLGAIPLGHPTMPPFRVLSQRPGETRRDTIASFAQPDIEHFQLPPAGALNPQPFAPRTVVASSPDGSRFCGALPDQSTTSIRCFDDRGRTLVSTSLRLSPRQVTDAVYDSMITLFSRGRGRTVDGMRALINRPRQLPPVMAILVDLGGATWLRRSHDYDPVAHWTRLRPDGSVRDDLVIPKRYRIIRPDGDTFWAAQADSDGLETLYRCRMQTR